MPPGWAEVCKIMAIVPVIAFNNVTVFAPFPLCGLASRGWNACRSWQARERRCEIPVRHYAPNTAGLPTLGVPEGQSGIRRASQNG